MTRPIARRLFWWLLASMMVLAACQTAPPVFKDQLAPDTPTGLIALAGNAQVTLSWNPNTEPDLALYNVYQGTTSGNLSKVAEVPAGTETYTASGLTNDIPYFFAIDAEDTSGNRSLPTTEVTATPTNFQVCIFDDPASVFDGCGFGP